MNIVEPEGMIPVNAAQQWFPRHTHSLTRLQIQNIVINHVCAH